MRESVSQGLSMMRSLLFTSVLYTVDLIAYYFCRFKISSFGFVMVKINT